MGVLWKGDYTDRVSSNDSGKEAEVVEISRRICAKASKEIITAFVIWTGGKDQQQKAKDQIKEASVLSTFT